MVAMVWSSTQRISRQETGKKKWYEKEPESAVSNETVTLTRSELQALLEAVNQGHSPPSTTAAYSEFHGTDLYRSDNPDGEESGYPASPDVHDLASSDHQESNFLNHRASIVRPVQSLSGESKIELKRKQWMKERAELGHWDPWGRPGCGAPSIKPSSLPYSECDPTHQRRVFSGQSSITTASYNAGGVPHFLRSSVGSNPSQTMIGIDDKREQQWQRELDKQSEVQPKNTGRWYADTPGAASPTGSLSTQVHSFARGQGIMENLDPEEVSKKLEKRQQMLEYQRFIKLQMEEKQKREEKEKQRKKQEEEEEEKRLEEERVRMKEQYEREQRQIKMKEEQEERKREVLLAAVKSAQESAEAEKRAKKAQRRKQIPSPPLQTYETFHPSRLQTEQSVADDDVDRIMSRVELKSSVDGIEENNNDIHAWLNSGARDSSNGQTTPIKIQPVLPVQTTIMASETKGRDYGIQTDPSRSPYIQNRLLTPSQWRIKERSVGVSSNESGQPMSAWGRFREIATQTESSTSLHKTARHSARSFASSNSLNVGQNIMKGDYSAIINGNGKQKAEQSVTSEQNENLEKPKWGVNRPVKNYVKMTERDPNYQYRRKLQEMRKQHWERELATQRAMNQTKRTTILAHRGGNEDRGRTVRLNTRCPSSTSERASTATPNDFHLGRTYTVSRGQRIYTRGPVSSREDSSVSRESPLPPLRRRWSRSSDSVRHSDSDEDDSPQAVDTNRRKWQSQENILPKNDVSGNEAPTPNQDKQMKDYSSSNDSSNQASLTPRRKWSEQESFDLERVALLRAIATRNGIEGAESSHRSISADQVQSGEELLANHRALTSHPTARQDKILQQLSSLRQGLLQKQKEIENLLLHSP